MKGTDQSMTAERSRVRFTAARLASALLGAALAAAGCSAQGNGGTVAGPSLAPPSIAPAPAAPASAAVALTQLPLEAYTLAVGPDAGVVDQAQAILIARCMAGRGYPDLTAAVIDGQMSGASGAATPVVAGAWGYVGRSQAAVSGFHPEAQGKPLSFSGTGESAAFQGCVPQAQATLVSGPPARGGKLIEQLSAYAVGNTLGDRRVETATGAWATCMKARGQAAADPQSLAQQPWPTPSATPAEVAAAAADEACTVSSNLAGLYFAVLAGYQRELIADHGPALAALRQAGQRELADARRTIASAPPLPSVSAPA